MVATLATMATTFAAMVAMVTGVNPALLPIRAGCVPPVVKLLSFIRKHLIYITERKFIFTVSAECVTKTTMPHRQSMSKGHSSRGDDYPDNADTRCGSLHQMGLSVRQFLKYAHHMLGYLAVLRFRTATNADGADYRSARAEWITAGHKRYTRVIGLDSH